MSSDLAASDPFAEIRQLDEPCRIGVIADTHIYDGGRRRLPDGVLRLFTRADVDLLVHLGDANVMSVLEELGSLAPLIAVPGNNDEPDIHFLLDETVTFSAGERTFGVLHGHGGRSARIEAARRFAGKVDCVLFGHSHQPMIDRKRDTILFNPGSATDRRFAEHFGIGLIDVADGAISPDLILYQDPDHLDHVDVTRTIVEPLSEGTS
jgi:putative phosphoesterase